jgi:hypothetical protein
MALRYSRRSAFSTDRTSGRRDPNLGKATGLDAFSQAFGNQAADYRAVDGNMRSPKTPGAMHSIGAGSSELVEKLIPSCR